MTSPAEIAKRLKEYCDANSLSPKDLAIAADVDRSQVYKILQGKFSRRSGNVNKLCKEAKLDFDLPTDAADYEPFIEALSEVWDGTPTRRAALVRVIKSLKGLS